MISTRRSAGHGRDDADVTVGDGECDTSAMATEMGFGALTELLIRWSHGVEAVADTGPNAARDWVGIGSASGATSSSEKRCRPN